MSNPQPHPPFDTEVLVVGAGPTGLALATTLRRAGHDPLVVERLTEGQGTSRAAVIHAHTLEVLESLGIGERLLGEGIRLSRFSIRDRDETLVRLRFDRLPSDHACLLMVTQDRTEHVLREALAEARGRVQWGTTVKSIVASGGGVTAALETREGTRRVRARYVVGADGMHSLVRTAADIGFTGSTYEESFVLADVEMDWPPGRDEVMLFFSPPGLVVVAPLAHGRFRVVATMQDAPLRPGVEDVQRLLDERGPQSVRSRVTAVHWSSRFRLHHRVADHYRSGPFLLVGDAAHVHSPAGGQGMNTGLVDACVLGRMLAEVLDGRQPDEWLDRYEGLRRPAAQQVLGLAGRLTAMATMKGAARRWARNLVLRTIGMLPPARRKLEMGLSGLARRDAARLPGGHVTDSRNMMPAWHRSAPPALPQR